MIACCIAYGVTVSYFMNDYAMVMRCGMPCYLLALLGLVARCIASVVTIYSTMRYVSLTNMNETKTNTKTIPNSNPNLNSKPKQNS